MLFVPQREIMISESRVEPLMGVALVHEDVIKKEEKDVRIFLQVVLTYRQAHCELKCRFILYRELLALDARQIHKVRERGRGADGTWILQ